MSRQGKHKGLKIPNLWNNWTVHMELIYFENPRMFERWILEAQMYEVSCLPCGIREYYEEEDEAITQAYNHERELTHSTSSGYFVSIGEVQ